MSRWRPFVVLETSAVLSGTANGITMVAFPWLVLQTTGDAAAAALVAAVSALPLLLSMLVTGSIVDMVGRRLVSVVSDVLSMVSVALVPVLAMTTGLDLGLLLLVAVLGAVFDPAGITARETMLPEAARAAGLPLERANGIHESAYGFAFLLGPGIGGVLIGVVGATTAFWATAAAFALSALLMATTRMPGGGRPPAHERPRGLWRSTREGLGFLWRDRVLRSVALLSALLVAVWLPVEGVVLPVFFTDIDQPAQLGLLITTMSAGGVLGALMYAAVGARVGRHRAFVASLILCALPVLGLALLPAYPVMLLLGFLTGVFYGAVNPISNIAMQNRTPEALRGRVIGVMGSAAYAAGPLGYLIAGPLIEAFGVQRTFLVLAVLLLAVTTLSAFLPSLRGLDDPPLPGSAADPRPDPRSINPDRRLADAEEIVASRVD
ncbi:MAG: MFS transporter [Candidatus Nanopelagicales bacterium]